MTKLKKVLLICLFSFLCLGFTKVSAETFTFEFKDSTNSDNNLIMQYLEDYNLSSEYIIEQCNSLHSSYGNKKYYACKLYIDYYLQNSIQYKKLGLALFTWDSSDKFNSVSFAKYNSGSSYNIFLNSSTTDSSISRYYFRYNNTTNLFDSTSSSTLNGNESMTGTKSGSIVKGSFFWVNLVYTNIDYLGNSLSWPIVNKSGSYTSFDLIINNETYGVSSNSQLPIYMFNTTTFNEWLGISYEKLNDLGTFENSNVLTYKIKDTEVGTNKELQLKFTFLNQLDVNANDITIYKYGSQALTEYSGTTCENSETDTICEFNLKYNVYESNSDKLMFDFKFNDTYNVKVEDNSGSNGIYSNYKDIEFEYKELNFKEISGGVFYLRNYDNFEYMKDYLYNVDYNFRFTNFKGNGNFISPTIYSNDIKYSNTYLIEDSNNVFKYNFDNYSTINNIGMSFIDFVFDSSLLEENKYSAFVVENPNYLGSYDTDNLDLYISYNSSLFNFNKLNYSTIVNNGNTDGYVSTGNDYNFIINGSQQTITGGSNSGHIVNFDNEIKVQYKGGLQYFKDKIIDMFEFVSEFYNTMPEKFRIAFSLIFVLLIGITLFRLLL